MLANNTWQCLHTSEPCLPWFATEHSLNTSLTLPWHWRLSLSSVSMAPSSMISSPKWCTSSTKSRLGVHLIWRSALDKNVQILFWAPQFVHLCASSHTIVHKRAQMFTLVHVYVQRCAQMHEDAWRCTNLHLFYLITGTGLCIFVH